MSGSMVTVSLPGPVVIWHRALTEALAPFEMYGAMTEIDFDRYSRWDAWNVSGGLDTGLACLAGHEADKRLIRCSEWSATSPDAPNRRCDGGPVELIDLETDRLDAAARAEPYWDEWAEVLAGHPHGLSLSDLYLEHGPHGVTYPEVRALFGRQPLIEAWARRRGLDPAVPWSSLNDPVEQLGFSREAYMSRVRDRAGVTPMHLTRDGHWLDAAEVDDYHEMVQADLAALAPHDYLVRIHIHY